MVIARAIVDKRGINKVPRYFVNPTLFSENAKMFTLVILTLCKGHFRTC